MKYCLVNGVQQNHLNVESRGLAYGDGIFTTAKIINGQVCYLPAHIQRLTLSCKVLGLPIPNKTDLTNQLIQVAKSYSLAVLKVIIMAASGGRGYARANSAENDIIIMVHDYPSHYDALAIDGVNLGISKQQLGINPMLSGLKHLNRLEQVLLRQELVSLQAKENNNNNIDDLVVTNIKNEVVEATSANVFYWHNNQLCTPNICHSGVNGIMRQTILQQYPQVLIKTVTLTELAQAQGMFICNCVMGIMPVKSFNGQKLSTKLAKHLMKSITINNGIKQ